MPTTPASRIPQYKSRLSRLVAGMLFATLPACAAEGTAEPDTCKTVRMADPGWTDITATNALAGIVLEALGYEQKIYTLSVPITYVGLQKGQIDVFLGNWMPAQKQLVAPLIADARIDVLHLNLPNAKFTLAVPSYVAAAGVRSFGDLARHADKFERKIYGIESGAPANQTIKRLLADHAYGLDGWSLVESSEQSMLSQVARKDRGKEWIVFLAWEPNQMNTRFKIAYLDGDTAYFGPHYGSTSVNTVSRHGYAAQCPNLGRLFSQIAFDVDLENSIIGDVLDRKQSARVSALRHLKADPARLRAWLAGIATRDGRDGWRAVKDSLFN